MLSTKLKEAAGNSADATLYVDDVFSTYLYAGNGLTQTIINGIDLAGKGGLVWVKSRTNPSGYFNHQLVDTNRGVNNCIQSNSTNGQSALGCVTGFGNSGFNIDAVFSQSGYDYASWTFREAAKFFDVVTYTGNGTTSQVIPHSLGIMPGMIIIKATSSTSNWFVWHRGDGTTDRTAFSLNLTGASGNNGLASFITSSNFRNIAVQDGAATYPNVSGTTYVAYLFAHDTTTTGIIRCGSYTGNGSAIGPTVSLGWEPQYLMVKNASGTGNWQILDSMRGMPVGSADATLQTNLSNAESSVEYLSPTATGFQITSTSTEVNTSGSTYIYMAIRRPNKPPTTGTQVFISGISANPVNLIDNKPIDMILARDDINGDILSPSSGFKWMIADRLRGLPTITNTVAPMLNSATTNAESIPAYNSYPNIQGVSSLNGISIANSSSNSDTLHYLFKRAPGFFDEVCYTGTGSATTQAHNLTVVPELMIVKSRNNVRSWIVYAATLGNSYYLTLNTSDVKDNSINEWNNTTPTASVFSIGSQDTNISNYTYVAYLFATLAGISKVGSYTGNGTGQAIACGFSAGARFVLIKRTDSTGDWYTFDSARGLTSGSSPYLLLNSTAAEVTGNNGVYASTGGFTLGSTASTTTNINAATYIFLAVT